MTDDMMKRLRGIDRTDIYLYETMNDAIDRIEELEAKLAKAAEVLRLALKYNTAMHRGASEFNKRVLATLAEIEGK